MKIGTEHEFTINGPGFEPLPVSDEIILSLSGGYGDEIPFSGSRLSKELQKTVLEWIPGSPSTSGRDLEAPLYRSLVDFYRIFNDRYHLLGLGMHPTLTLSQTSVWNHGEQEYFAAYDRLFDLRQHGWLNIQALQINLEYGCERDLVERFNLIRVLLPYLVAVTASSPFVEGRLTGSMDNRLLYYRENQRRIPLICDRIIPIPITGFESYLSRLEAIYAALRAEGAGILCEEWVNSSGLIVRFSRPCLEIKALDEQECLRSDFAVCAFVTSLLRAGDLGLEEDHDALLALNETAIRSGTADLKPELARLFRIANAYATPDERRYLQVIGRRIEHGSLAELMRDRWRSSKDMGVLLHDMAGSLRTNVPFMPD